MKKESRNYETIFIVDPLLEDSKIDSITDKYAELIRKNKCIVTKTDKWGRKKLAYPIKKKLNGFYVSIEFQGKPEILAKLVKAYQSDESILRYLTTYFDNKTLRNREEYFGKKLSDALSKEEKPEELIESTNIPEEVSPEGASGPESSSA